MLLFLFLNLELYVQEAVGKWKTIDDETGKTRSIVEIYEEHGKFYGKITALLLDPEEPKDPICNECDISDPRYKQKIMVPILLFSPRLALWPEIYSVLRLLAP